MAYHIFTDNNSSPNDLSLDMYLGSATTLDRYWEAVGRELSLPVISALTEKADSEEGLSLRCDDLIQFKNEIDLLDRYWRSQSSADDLPNDFLANLRTINEQVDRAIVCGATVMIA